VKKSGGKDKSFATQTGLEFKGIDVLNVSVGKARFIDLKDQQNNREQVIGLENCVTPNVTTPTDLGPLVAIIVLRSDGFFNSLVEQKNSGSGLLQLLGK